MSEVPLYCRERQRGEVLSQADRHAKPGRVGPQIFTVLLSFFFLIFTVLVDWLTLRRTILAGSLRI
jgi:hypothetical protein